MLVGGPRSGRTTTLRTIAAAAAQRHDASRLHLYVIDCAGGGLAGLRRLPHCGAHVSQDHPDAIARVVDLLTERLVERQRDLRINYGADTSTSPPSGAAPQLLLLIDGMDALAECSDQHDSGRTLDKLLVLARDGAAFGITLAITGSRSTLTSRVTRVAARRFVLRLTDPADYALADLPARRIPKEFPPGRALSVPDSEQVQFAHIGDSDAERDQQTALAVLAECSHAVDGSHGPRIIAPLPESVAVRELPQRSGHLVLGVGRDDASPLYLDLWREPRRWLITGPERSGRTTCLHLILRQCLDNGEGVTVACRSRSPLAKEAERAGCRLITPDSAPYEAATDSSVVLVDDVTTFTGSLAERALCELVSADGVARLVVFTAKTLELAHAFHGLSGIARQIRVGVALQPGPAEAEFFSVVTRGRPPRIPGRGLFIDDDSDSRGLPVQIALP